jgi:MtrB/PioB family decaheme-associated outer membrane protein
MRVRFGLLLAGALSLSTMSGAAIAADAAMPTKAPVIEAPDVWWFHGYLEAGWRGFVNNPCRDCTNFSRQGSLAKFYEYNSIKPGPFMDGHIATGSQNGLYQVDLWAKNVGYTDQAYLLSASKAGEHYFDFNWDQTPHLYSTSANTLYNGVGTNALTLPAGLSAALFAAAGGTAAGSPTSANLTAAQGNAIRALINANTHQTDIGIRRDTAAAEYRYTPNDHWDIRADFSDMHRFGTQVEGVVFSPTTSAVRVDAPRPIDDHTQNYGLNGEYAGTSPWNQRFNFKLGYAGSTYSDGVNGFTVANPFCRDGGTNDCASGPFGPLVGGIHDPTTTSSSPLALLSTDPNNHTNMFSGTLGADLPFNSRYMGTLSYSMGRQDQAFLPFTLTPNILSRTAPFPAAVINGASPTSLAALPALSLNGGINTILSNNVLTTRFNPDLTAKTSYRYYSVDNTTPELFFSNWILADTTLAGTTPGAPTQTGRTANYAPVATLSNSYIKQNFGEEVNWRPLNSVNLGAAYGWERYDWTRADASVTNENSGRFYGDWKPASWVTARASVMFGQRRAENYDYLANVGNWQWPGLPAPANGQYSPTFRQFNLDDRNRTKGQASLSVDVIRGLTVTPTVGFRLDDYNLATATTTVLGTSGMNRDQSYTAGIEATYRFNADTGILLSYMFEPHKQDIQYMGSTTLGSDYRMPINDQTNTFMVALDQVVIPNKLDFKVGYTLSVSHQDQNLLTLTNQGPTLATGGQFPGIKTSFQRVDAQARYKVDESLVRSAGLQGEVFLKLRYAWERTNTTNWQEDNLQAYMFSPTAAFSNFGYMTWMAGDNPNYNVHMVAGSVVLKW